MYTNVGIRQPSGDILFVHSDLSGDKIYTDFAEAVMHSLIKYGDIGPQNRMFIHFMLGDDRRESTNFGIYLNSINSNDHDILVYVPEDNEVRIYQDGFEYDNPTTVLGSREFIEKYRESLPH